MHPDLDSGGGYAARFTSLRFGLRKCLARPAAAAEPIRYILEITLFQQRQK